VKECNFGGHSSPSTRSRLGCGGRVFLTIREDHGDEA
jgi:hypothetical protein